jgi:hypothetical protein
MGQPSFTIKVRISGFGCLVRTLVGELSHAEYIGMVRRTRGTETSQYLEERTSTETPLVVASERGPGQCLVVSQQNRLESRAVAGDSPVCEDELQGLE